MTLPNTGINLRQQGVLRIEIAAIVMLLIALVIVLVTNMLPAHLPDVAQTGVTIKTLPSENVGAAVLHDPSLLPAARQESATP